MPNPISIRVDAMGSAGYTNAELEEIVKKNFPLTPYGFITEFKLNDAIFLPTATYGHFGREEFPWEAIREISK
jgi:S-adenosylmethionine synthetase